MKASQNYPRRNSAPLFKLGIIKMSNRVPHKIQQYFQLIERLVILLCVLTFLINPASTFAVGVTMEIDSQKIVKKIDPGAVGWGAMWKKDMIWPRPPDKINTDQDHAGYIEELARVGAPLAKAADMRNISWPWGVSFSTWGVNWENSAKPWSQRPNDCARIFLLNKGSGWCEKTIVGVGDLMTLAGRWNLEAVTVAVPLSVLDGKKVRWGPSFFSHAIDDGTIEKISDHAVGLIQFMKSHPAWNQLQRVYLSAGCEWRHYGQRSAVLTYAKLIKRIRAKIGDEKVIVVASASDSADLEAFKANSWNKPLYEQLHNVKGVALDLHRYRGMVGLKAAPDGSTAATQENVAKLARTGVTQRNYFTVHPGHWKQKGPAMPSVLLENAIHGLIGDHSKRSDKPWPWPVVVAHADLVREALASSAMTFLGWTWFPENLPPEWPHGALRPDGTLAAHAKVQAFLSRYHQGSLLFSRMNDESAVRGNAVRGADGKIHLYGGNFSMEPHTLKLNLTGAKVGQGTVEYMTDIEIHKATWDGRSPLALPPMTLWRISF